MPGSYRKRRRPGREPRGAASAPAKRRDSRTALNRAVEKDLSPRAERKHGGLKGTLGA